MLCQEGFLESIVSKRNPSYIVKCQKGSNQHFQATNNCVTISDPMSHFHCQNCAKNPPNSASASEWKSDRWSFLCAQFMHRRRIDFNLLHNAANGFSEMLKKPSQPATSQPDGQIGIFSCNFDLLPLLLGHLFYEIHPRSFEGLVSARAMICT